MMGLDVFRVAGMDEPLLMSVRAVFQLVGGRRSAAGKWGEE
jgi:hypothetical protein